MARAVGHELPGGDYETLAGLLIAYRGALLTPGETVRVPLPDDPADLVLEQPVHRALAIDVLALSRHVPSQLRVRLIELHDPAETTADAGARDPYPHEEGR